MLKGKRLCPTKKILVGNLSKMVAHQTIKKHSKNYFIGACMVKD